MLRPTIMRHSCAARTDQGRVKLISGREKRYGGVRGTDLTFPSVWHERPPRDRLHRAASNLRRCDSSALDPARPEITALAPVTQHELIFRRWGLGDRHSRGLA